MRGRPWTVKEEEKLIELYTNTSITCKQIAGELDRSLCSVDHRIRQLRKTGLLDYRNPNIIKNKYKKDLTDVITLTPSGAYFIISVLSDGSLQKRSVSFGFRRRDCIEFRDIFCHILKITPPLHIRWENYDKMPREDRGDFKIYSTKLAELLAYRYGLPMGKKSGLVRIPRQLMKSEDQKIHGAIMRAAFECEGSVNLHEKALGVTIGNTSILFLQDLSELLESYNIDSRIYDIRLRISVLDSLLKFYEMAYSVFNLKLNITAKKKDLKELINRKSKKRSYKNRNATKKNDQKNFVLFKSFCANYFYDIAIA